MRDDRDMDAAFATYWAFRVVRVRNKVKFKKEKEKDIEITQVNLRSRLSRSRGF